MRVTNEYFLRSDDLIGLRVRAKLMAGARVARFHVTRTPSPSPPSSSWRRNNAAFFSLSPFALCPPLPSPPATRDWHGPTDHKIKSPRERKLVRQLTPLHSRPPPLLNLLAPFTGQVVKRGSNPVFWNAQFKFSLKPPRVQACPSHPRSEENFDTARRISFPHSSSFLSRSVPSARFL